MKIITTITGIGDSRYKSWVRDLTGVNLEKTNGYAFLFENWYRAGRKAELEVGTLLLRYGMEGSRKYVAPVVEIVRVDENGDFEVLLEAEGADWALDLRGKAADLFGEQEICEDSIKALTVEEIVQLLVTKKREVLCEALREILSTKTGQNIDVSICEDGSATYTVGTESGIS